MKTECFVYVYEVTVSKKICKKGRATVD